MCGITGIFDLKATRDVNRNALRRMTDALRHRGPDGEGYFLAPGIGFGHRRLAIIDKQGGAQPFHAQTDDCVLSFNGEIYNFQALAQELAAKVQIKTRSDTEILAEGLALEGEAFVHKLRGMFAFSFWEPKRRRLTLGRDRLGERPLYYATTADGYLLFASEPGALLASGMVEADIDPRAVADYCFYGYVPDPKTIYRGVYKLAPGHLLSVNAGGALQLERYWRPVFANGGGVSFDDAVAMLRDRLDKSVASQMISDVPLGAFLSGGVDSSGIVASMAQTGNDLVTCSVGFHETSHDEREYARKIAVKYSSAHHEHVADYNAADLIDRVATSFGEPFADTSALPSYLVAQLARQHVTVALSGDGGDEIFAGYRRYRFHLAEEKLRRMAPLTARRAVFGPAGAAYPKLDWAPQPMRFKTTLQSLAQSSVEGYAAAAAINLPVRVQKMLSTDLKHKLDHYHPQSVVAGAMAEADTDDPLARAQYADLLTWLPGRMLAKVDRSSMAHSLEVRPPFLDHRLVEWAGSLPSAYKLKRNDGKRILKRALEERLGGDFVNRKKQGFDLPIAAWMRQDGNNPLLRLNASRLWRECGLFNEAAVDQMARAHKRGGANCAQELWTVIMFDAFLRTAPRN